MAHYPMFEADPAKLPSDQTDSSGEIAPVGREESDLGELAAKFALHSGGRVSPELSSDLALEIVLNELVEQACLTTGANGAAIVLERDGEWVCRASAGESAPPLGVRLNTASGLSGACIRSRTVQLCHDAQHDPRVDREACRELGVSSVIILPLLLGKRLVGLFEMFSSRNSAFRERDERTLEALSRSVIRNLQRASQPLVATPTPARIPSAWPQFIVADSNGIDLKHTDLNRAALNQAESKGTDSNPTDSKGENRESDRGRITDKQAVTPNFLFDSADVSSVTTLRDRAHETASDRSIHPITWVLGITLLSALILLGMLTGQRMSGRKTRVRLRPMIASANSSPVSTNQPNETPAGTPVAPDAQATPQAPASSPAAQGQTPAVARTETAPTGTLVVYEKGKEIFRLPPAQGAGVARPAGVEAIPPHQTAQTGSPTIEDGVLHRVEPEYPEEARKLGIEGAVVVDVNIDPNGKVLEVKTVSGSPLLIPAVSNAVKQWVFKPQSVGKKLVPMQTRITLNFKLPH